jgi:periplasmic protein TonB
MKSPNRTPFVFTIAFSMLLAAMVLQPVRADEKPKMVVISGREMGKKVTHREKPDYPPEAVSKHIEGTVRLKLIIGTDGAPRQLQVISGQPLLVKAALDAVRKWRWEPTTINEQPVEVVTEVDVNFKL